MKFPKIVSALLCSAILATPVSAFDYDLIREGQVFDYDVVGQFTNPAVRVLKKQGGKVLIEYIEGDRAGQVEWVSPTRLMTMDESRKQEGENIGAGIGVGIVVICAITGACEDDKTKKKQPLVQEKGKDSAEVPTSLPDGRDYEVAVKNDCSRDVKFWIAYYRDGKFYGSSDYWNLKAKGTFDLKSKGNPVTADNELAFIYVESVTGGLVWNGQGKSYIRMDGERYDMRRYEMAKVDGYYQVTLTCG